MECGVNGYNQQYATASGLRRHREKEHPEYALPDEKQPRMSGEEDEMGGPEEEED